MVFLYMILMGLGGYVAGRLIFKEWKTSQHEISAVPVPVEDFMPASVTQCAPETGPHEDTTSLEESFNKMEILLREKQQEIERLESRLYGEIRHRKDFDRMRTLLQTQIQELKEHNRLLKLEIAKLSDQHITKFSIPLTGPDHADIQSESFLREAQLN